MSLENPNRNTPSEEKLEEAAKSTVPHREMMQMPDGSVADVTGMSPQEKREHMEAYKNNK